MARIPKPFRMLAALLAVTFGAAFLLLGQQAPSEESDWPWKAVTESKVFINGAPAGKLSDPAPLTKRLGVLFDQGRRAGRIDRYDNPPVLIVADPDTAIGRISELTSAVEEGTGAPVLVGRPALDKSPGGSKPNPRVFVVTTENVDTDKARRLANLTDTELESVGYYAAMLSQDDPEAVRVARTYESSIEIGSDGSYYVNERTAQLPSRPTTNVESRVMNPILASANTNRMPPSSPLRQRTLPRADLASAVAELVRNAKTESQKVLIIASEKARYEALLKILEIIDPETRVIVLVRRVQSR